MWRNHVFALLLIGIALSASVCKADPSTTAEPPPSTVRDSNPRPKHSIPEMVIALMFTVWAVVSTPTPTQIPDSDKTSDTPRRSWTVPQTSAAWAEWVRLDDFVLARSIDGLTYPALVDVHLENAKKDLRRGEVGAAIYAMRLAANRLGANEAR